MSDLIRSMGAGYITYIKGKTPDDIVYQAEQIRMPFDILGAYGLNGLHYLVVKTERRLTIKKQGDK